MTWPVLAMALALSVSPPTVVEKDGVRVEAAVRAHIYSWKVTNLGTELLEAEPTWTYRDGTVQTVGLPDILVVAPYNPK